MKMEPIRILLLEDSETDAELVLHELRQSNLKFACVRVDERDSFVRALEEFRPDIILSDYAIPRFGGLLGLEIAKEACPDVPYILVSGAIGEDVAIESLKSGATDYVLKDRLSRLGPAVDRAMKEVEVRKDQKRLEEQLQQAQKMEALGRLAGGVAHDFNNLLTVILGYSDMLVAELGSDTRLGEEVEKIRAAGKSAGTLTSQLLAFSRKQPFNPCILNLNDVIQNLEKMLPRLIGDRVNLDIAIDPDVGPVRADPGGIEQIVINLAVNAKDAMPQGGTLTVGSAQMDLREPLVTELATVTPGHYVLLAVRDTGMGMDAEVLSHLFEPFFTTKEPGMGTGLGLATIHGIVRKLGGVITVESKPGRGSTFRVFLPRVEHEEAGSSETADALPSDSGTETVLIAEDDPVVRMLTGEILRRKGYEVLEAGGGQEALAIARRHDGPIHLLLSDLSMPGMTGLELRERFMKMRPSSKTLFMSGYSKGEVTSLTPKELPASLIAKPFSPDVLAWNVRKVLDKRPVA